MAKAFKCLHSCYLESNLCQLAISKPVSKPTGLPEPREINYNRTRVGSDSSSRLPGAREGRGRGRCVLTSVPAGPALVCSPCTARKPGPQPAWDWRAVCHLLCLKRVTPGETATRGPRRSHMQTWVCGWQKRTPMGVTGTCRPRQPPSGSPGCRPTCAQDCVVQDTGPPGYSAAGPGPPGAGLSEPQCPGHG